MAYPTVSAPYGFQAINRVDGMPYAGQTRLVPIASTYNTAIFAGDLVKIVAAGTIEKFTGTTTGSPVGVCVGVQYVNSLSQFTPAQYYPGTSVTDAYAIVVDDPLAAFKVAVTNAGSAMSSAARAAVGANMSVLVGTGDTATGNSGASVLAGSEAATAGLVVRVIDTVDETKTAADTFVELIVKINLHQYNNTTGV
ncbi:MAG: hypothetical protein CMA72_01660 [Euryarchaeota archaeon]|nr:hypothetical protein [Euryarchaeota archaeon]|tara:strand:+ start:144 stop:731 length:588 start_codon:yes stop_codon:yes gene_type:complete